MSSAVGLAHLVCGGVYDMRGSTRGGMVLFLDDFMCQLHVCIVQFLYLLAIDFIVVSRHLAVQ